MPYDQTLAARVRRALAREGASERKMMGGLVFLVGGRIACGVDREDLIVRVGVADEALALSRPHARPMTIGGRTSRGFVLVAKPGTARAASLRAWIARGVAQAREIGAPAPRTLPSRSRAGSGAASSRGERRARPKAHTLP